jgi:hypothetical protein
MKNALDAFGPEKQGFFNPYKQFKNPGDYFTFRFLTYPTVCYRFTYPTYNPETKKDTVANFNLTNHVLNTYAERGSVEEGILGVWQEALAKKSEAVKENLTRQRKSPAEIDKALEQVAIKNGFLDFFGPRSRIYGAQILHRNQPETLDIKSTSYNPLNSRSPVLDTGIQQLMNLTEDGKLVYTPFLSKWSLTCTDIGKKWNAFAPSISLPEEYKRLLPASFAMCIWCHPDDVDEVQGYLVKRMSGLDVPAPDYRDYPSETGDIVFIERTGELDPVIINLYDGPLAEDFGPEVIEAIANRPSFYDFTPSTDDSLLGGWAIETEDGNREYVIEGTEGAKWIPGKFEKRPFNPYAATSEGASIFENNYIDMEWIANKIESLGIGVHDPLAAVTGEVSASSDDDWESRPATAVELPADSPAL